MEPQRVKPPPFELQPPESQPMDSQDTDPLALAPQGMEVEPEGIPAAWGKVCGDEEGNLFPWRSLGMEQTGEGEGEGGEGGEKGAGGWRHAGGGLAQ